MNLKQTYITKNDCYRAGRTITPKGIMVHSTATPGVMAADWFSRWNRPDLEVAVHAFVDNKEVCQHLPWNHRAWHCGDAGNNTHISFEMCEPANWKTNQAYCKACYVNAVELAAYLCQTYSLSPSSIISHAEGYQKGIASNHADPTHWWKYFGYTMDQFRADVKIKLTGGFLTPNPTSSQKRPILQIGSVGKDVSYLQERLNHMRITLALAYNSLLQDGIFGPKTKEAVRAFQAARKLAIDGIVGPDTWAALAVSYGDVNGDGTTNATDALHILQAAVNKRKLTQAQQQAADMNADGKINANDAAKILRQAVSKK